VFKKPVIIITIIIYINVFLSCGIDEYYYLPQVPEITIQASLNTYASVNFPKIPDEYYYAGYYTIFYRIYVSNHNTQNSSSNEFNLISPNLSSDYNYLLPITNPVNTSATVSTNTFKNRNFFELEFDGMDNATMLPKTGGTLRLNFQTATGSIPVASIDNGVNNIRLIRSSKLISPEPPIELYFQNTQELRELSNANNNKNADVAGRSGEMNYTYVAMYILAVGTNPSNFTTVYSKPTFISVFKLPDRS
jgi:hypothetical protein